MQLAGGVAHQQSFDEDALRRDASTFLTIASARAFGITSLAKLRALLDQSAPAEHIDRLLASLAPIEITINPEARVSISRTATALPNCTLGKRELWLMRIVNQGRVSSTLNLRLLGDEERLVELEQITPQLVGASVEYRVLLLTVIAARPIDLTIAADAGPGTDDLGLRSQLVLLLRCSVTPPS
jgi:hypothetical protein